MNTSKNQRTGVDLSKSSGKTNAQKIVTIGLPLRGRRKKILTAEEKSEDRKDFKILTRCLVFSAPIFAAVVFGYGIYTKNTVTFGNFVPYLFFAIFVLVAFFAPKSETYNPFEEEMTRLISLGYKINSTGVKCRDAGESIGWAVMEMTEGENETAKT
jgi:hypothetical protein